MTTLMLWQAMRGCEVARLRGCDIATLHLATPGIAREANNCYHAFLPLLHFLCFPPPLRLIALLSKLQSLLHQFLLNNFPNGSKLLVLWPSSDWRQLRSASSHYNVRHETINLLIKPRLPFCLFSGWHDGNQL